MAVKVQIDASEVEALMRRYPEKMLKLTKKSMRSAASESAKIIRRAGNPRFASLVGYKVASGKLSGDLSAAVGYFRSRQKEKSDVDDWFKAYWSEYGTLENRYAGHRFQRRRAARSRHFRGGIMPMLLYEGCKSDAVEAYQRRLENEIVKNFEKEFKK